MIDVQGSSGGKPIRIIVLEAANIEAIKQGRPAVTQDQQLVIAYTPDPVWLADKLLDSNGDPAVICKLIDEGAKRPQKSPTRPTHAPHHAKFRKE